jgi:hypothetical protein
MVIAFPVAHRVIVNEVGGVQSYAGSKRTFSALLKTLVKKKKIGLVLALTRRNASPYFCALLPQVCTSIDRGSSIFFCRDPRRLIVCFPRNYNRRRRPTRRAGPSRRDFTSYLFPMRMTSELLPLRRRTEVGWLYGPSDRRVPPCANVLFFSCFSLEFPYKTLPTPREMCCHLLMPWLYSQRRTKGCSTCMGR